MRKRLLTIVSLSVFCFFTTQPIQESTVHLATGVTGIVSFVGGYFLSSHCKVAYPIIWSALSAAGISGLLYAILYRFTPRGRLELARMKAACIERNSIATHSFTDEATFFNALQEVYLASDLWLVDAYNSLKMLAEQACSAHELLDEARTEGIDDYILVQECNTLLPRVRQAQVNISNAIKMIRNNKEYIAQLKIHNQVLAEEKKLQV